MRIILTHHPGRLIEAYRAVHLAEGEGEVDFRPYDDMDFLGGMDIRRPASVETLTKREVLGPAGAIHFEMLTVLLRVS